jgi:hypothetical protein
MSCPQEIAGPQILDLLLDGFGHSCAPFVDAPAFCMARASAQVRAQGMETMRGSQREFDRLSSHSE